MPGACYADLTPAQYQGLVTALHGHWRIATRMVIVLLPAAGMSAPQIADLLCYDPVTVRRWAPSALLTMPDLVGRLRNRVRDPPPPQMRPVGREL